LIEKVRTNLLTYSNTFSDAAWTKNNLTLTAGQVDPDGGTNATRAEFSGVSYIFQAPSTAFATASIYVRATSGTANIRIGDSNGNFVVAYALTESWQRITAFGATMAGISIDSFIGGSWTAQDVIIAFAQFETGDIATPYIPTTTAAVSVGITADIPRLDYTGGGCPSLLLEPQRTNLTLQSENFTATWIPNGAVTITANTTISPDGFQNADTIAATGAFNGVFQAGIGVANATQHTFSLYVKNISGATSINIGVSSNPSSATINFNATTGVISSVGASITASSVVNAGNGWYRLNATYTTTGTSNDFIIYATGTMTFAVYGCQLEAGSYVSSYIPTLGSSVTRLADTASKTGISSLIGQQEGVLYCDIDFIPHASQVVIAIDDWANLKVINIGSPSNTELTAQVFNGSNQYTATFGTAVIGQRYKCALAYKANDFAFYVNGVQVSTSASGSVPSSLNFQLGAFTAGQTSDNQYNSAALYPVRLSNSELASLTSL
jgi:hypothetical protein